MKYNLDENQTLEVGVYFTWFLQFAPFFFQENVLILVLWWLLEQIGDGVEFSWWCFHGFLALHHVQELQHPQQLLSGQIGQRRIWLVPFIFFPFEFNAFSWVHSYTTTIIRLTHQLSSKSCLLVDGLWKAFDGHKTLLKLNGWAGADLDSYAKQLRTKITTKMRSIISKRIWEETKAKAWF